MTREQLFQYAADNYGAAPEYPWADLPMHAVLRHEGNRKWFALVMRLPAQKLNLPGGMTDVLNVKCPPPLIEGVIDGESVLPSYHMNRGHWVSIILPKASDPQILSLLDISYELTKPAAKKRGR